MMRTRFAATLTAVLLVVTAGALLAGCGVATSDVPTTTTTSSAARLPPIIYRPAGLGRSQKVPLLIALHGSQGNPQDMEGLTHFEQVADEHGFVVAYLASADLAHPWNPRTNDTAYVSSEITQITQSENIDPNRVYVTGFSAGGYETWVAGCQLSNQVAAIAIVSNNMSGKLYQSCRPVRPISHLLMVGTLDSIRQTGIPGVLPSAAQTTAKWRAIDGCSAQSTPTVQQPTPVVTQTTWTSCTNGSAVSLIEIQGAHHVWPPIGLGAPQNYSASEAVWAFLSAHVAAPTKPSASVTSLRAQTVGRKPQTVGRKRKLVAKFRLGETLTVQVSLSARGRTLASKKFNLASGPAVSATVVVPRSVRAGRYTVTLVGTDVYGRTLKLTRTISLPKQPA